MCIAAVKHEATVVISLLLELWQTVCICYQVTNNFCSTWNLDFGASDHKKSCGLSKGKYVTMRSTKNVHNNKIASFGVDFSLQFKLLKNTIKYKFITL